MPHTQQPPVAIEPKPETSLLSPETIKAWSHTLVQVAIEVAVAVHLIAFIIRHL